MRTLWLFNHAVLSPFIHLCLYCHKGLCSCIKTPVALVVSFIWSFMLQAITALKKGAYLLKYGRRGKPKFCPFRLSNVSCICMFSFLKYTLTHWRNCKNHLHLKVFRPTSGYPTTSIRPLYFLSYEKPNNANPWGKAERIDWFTAQASFKKSMFNNSIPENQFSVEAVLISLFYPVYFICGFGKKFHILMHYILGC